MNIPSCLLTCVLIGASFTAHALNNSKMTDAKLGRHLFEETRFAEFFARNSNGDLNAELQSADPSLAQLETMSGAVKNPMSAKSTSCAACHFTLEASPVGISSFADFSRRSPVPRREDGLTHTLRNSPTIAGTARDDIFLHYDGEFSTPEDLSFGGLTGRNFGWLKNELGQAVSHIARVLRNDQAPAWTKSQVPYREAFARLGFDSNQASDEALVRFAAKQIAAYMRTVDFSRSSDGHYNGSPYDLFLAKNGLPQAPASGETPIAYMKRLAKLAQNLKSPKWVEPSERQFKDHNQEFKFGQQELFGLVKFSTTAQCVQCHAAPDFTDHLFHNIGISQEEYDSINGFESFLRMDIPSLDKRTDADFDRLAKTPVPGQRGQTDLGAWIMLFNPKYPAVQPLLLETIAKSLEKQTSAHSHNEWLELSIGLFKTPTLRNLGHTAPYFHTGHLDTIEEAVFYYVRASNFARRESMRNPDPKLKEASFWDMSDIRGIAAFLRSLNEDAPRP